MEVAAVTEDVSAPTAEVAERPEPRGVFKKPDLSAAPSRTRRPGPPTPGGDPAGPRAPDGTSDPAEDVPKDPKGPDPPLRYEEPCWGRAPPDAPYSLEVLKGGAVVDTVPLKERSFFVVGRLPGCDVALQHPSISRHHAVLQYRGRPHGGTPAEGVGDTGFYVHDLGSTHGTVVNKNKIPPKTFIRLRVGHVLKFGGSTRLFVLQVNTGPGHPPSIRVGSVPPSGWGLTPPHQGPGDLTQASGVTGEVLEHV